MSVNCQCNVEWVFCILIVFFYYAMKNIVVLAHIESVCPVVGSRKQCSSQNHMATKPVLCRLYLPRHKSTFISLWQRNPSHMQTKYTICIFSHTLSASHTGLTTMLRPSCDLKMLESWANSRLIARLVAEVLGDRVWSWVIVRADQSQQTVQKLLRWDF